ncbi:ABC-three component system protein [Photobacterium swingsii]|uniref:ABC-three component system protein n=1 Tax=Photobacterium swingsii TaxID=680026 RepID=UPI00352CDBB5
MDSVTRAWYGLMIENSLLKKREQEYEDFFCEIMEALYSDNFQLVKAAGSDGDGKADGYLIPEKCVFQSYAPSSGFQKTKLLNKIEGDFNGAKNKWGEEMQKWVFVHSESEGLPKYALDLITKLQSENPAIEIKSWRPTFIKRKALLLPLEYLIDLFGTAPTAADVTSLTHEPIKTLLKAMEANANKSEENILPVSFNKLKFNSLSGDVEVLLSAGRRKENLVADLLNRWPDPTYGEELAQSFHLKYEKLKSLNLNPDDMFMDLKSYAGGSIDNVSSQVSSLAILSYFFERCDIYENAPDGWAV